MISTGEDDFTKLYMDSLKLKEINDNLITKEIEIAQETGQSYIPNEDNRTSQEKMLSIIDMKSQLFKILKPLNSDSAVINTMIALLSDENVEFVYKNHPYIVEQLTKKYGNRVDADTFDSFVDEYQDSIISVKGLDNTTLGYSLSIQSILDNFNNTYQGISALISNNEEFFNNDDPQNVDPQVEDANNIIDEYVSKTHPKLSDYENLNLNGKTKIINFLKKSSVRRHLLPNNFFEKINIKFGDEVSSDLDEVNTNTYLSYLSPMADLIEEVLIPMERIYFTESGNNPPTQGGRMKGGKIKINLDRYKPIGRYYVNHGRLIGRGVLSVRSKSGQVVREIGTQIVSNNVKNVVDKIIKHKNLDYNDINNLTEDERLLIDKIAYKAGLDDIKMPTTYKTKLEQLINRYLILKGEIEAGNDNSSIIKELKQVILKLSNDGILPKGQAREILLDIVALGY